jgi:hypothetical protein
MHQSKPKPKQSDFSLSKSLSAIVQAKK